MHVAKTSAAEAVDLCRTCLDPTVVEQIVLSAGRDGKYDFFNDASVGRVVECDKRFFADLVVERRDIIRVECDRLAVNTVYDIAGTQF